MSQKIRGKRLALSCWWTFFVLFLFIFWFILFVRINYNHQIGIKMCQKVQKKCTQKSYDKTRHWPFVDKRESRSRCKFAGCKGFTHIFCTKCEMHFCITSKRNCFYKFHNEQPKTMNKQRRRQQQQQRSVAAKKERKFNGNRETTSQAASSSLDAPGIGSSGSKHKLSSGPNTSRNSSRAPKSSKGLDVTPCQKVKYNTRKSPSSACVSAGKQE